MTVWTLIVALLVMRYQFWRSGEAGILRHDMNIIISNHHM